VLWVGLQPDKRSASWVGLQPDKRSASWVGLQPDKRSASWVGLQPDNAAQICWNRVGLKADLRRWDVLSA